MPRRGYVHNLGTGLRSVTVVRRGDFAPVNDDRPGAVGTVVHVVDTLRIGGAERIAVDVSNGLASRGWAVTLVATRELGPLAEDVDPDVEVVCLGRKRRFDLGGLRRFRRLVARQHPDIVHAHGWSSLQFCTVGLIGRRHSPALVFHDHRPARLAALPASYRLAAWPLTAAHVAVDRSLLDGALKTRRPVIRRVVANGIPLDQFPTKSNYDLAPSPRLVLTANFRPQKDHPVLLSALSHLAQDGISLQLDLVGALSDASYVADCRQAIDDLDLTNSVQILGSRRDVGSLLPTYDVGVLSSRTESGPIALIEYLACGLPFVVTDVGEIPAMLPEELRRWVVPAGDPAALAAKIHEVLELSPVERSKNGQIGSDFARANLSIDRTVETLEDVYRRVR